MHDLKVELERWVELVLAVSFRTPTAGPKSHPTFAKPLLTSILIGQQPIHETPELLQPQDE